jgi:hypothetical protein
MGPKNGPVQASHLFFFWWNSGDFVIFAKIDKVAYEKVLSGHDRPSGGGALVSG